MAKRHFGIRINDGPPTRLSDLRDLADADVQTARHIRLAHQLRNEIRRLGIVDLKDDILAIHPCSIRLAGERNHGLLTPTFACEPSSTLTPVPCVAAPTAACLTGPGRTTSSSPESLAPCSSLTVILVIQARSSSVCEP